jgi:hypothetical protein
MVYFLSVSTIAAGWPVPAGHGLTPPQAKASGVILRHICGNGGQADSRDTVRGRTTSAGWRW